MPSDLSIGVIGSTGRLGSRVLAECRLHDVPVALAAHRGEWREDGRPTVVVDASRGAALPEVVEYCRERGAALVECASDLGPEAARLLAELAREVAVVRAANLSVGHWMQQHLLETAARLVGALDGAPPRASVFERHTAAKADRPSASARSLAAAWEAGSGGEKVEEIASYRAGHPVSEHSFQLDFPHESLVLRHEVRDLAAAAPGALAAARWAHQAPAGLVTVKEVYDQMFLGATR